MPLEYSEAKTFLEQSAALLSEIKPALMQKDGTALAQLETQLSTLTELIGRVADPKETKPVVEASIGLLKDKFGMAAVGGDIAAALELLKQMKQAVAAGEWAQAETCACRRMAFTRSAQSKSY